MKQHLNTVLNTSSMLSVNVINTFPSYAVHDEMDCVPSLPEVSNKLSLIAGGRAGGGSCILSEMVKAYCAQLRDSVRSHCVASNVSAPVVCSHCR